MEPEGSLRCSQEPSTGPYPQPDIRNTDSDKSGMFTINSVINYNNLHDCIDPRLRYTTIKVKSLKLFPSLQMAIKKANVSTHGNL
jgi:hypothetical protein